MTNQNPHVLYNEFQEFLIQTHTYTHVLRVKLQLPVYKQFTELLLGHNEATDYYNK